MLGKAAAEDIKPFKESDDSEAKTVAWIGPKKVCCCTLEIHGPLQLVFVALALAAIVFLFIEYLRDDGGPDAPRTIAGVLFILVCFYLVYLGKAIYILRAFRREIDKFRGLNQRLKGEIDNLSEQNKEYNAKNVEHENLNRDLSEKIGTLGHVEEKLTMLSADCNGSVQQARVLLERLERNIRLDTVNSVFLFFDRSDRNKNGRVDVEEVDMFVDNLGFLWKHLPAFEPTAMKKAITEQGGLSLDQVHKLVEAMMLDQDAVDAATVANKLETAFRKTQSSLKAADSVEVLTPGQPV